MPVLLTIINLSSQIDLIINVYASILAEEIVYVDQ